MGTTLFGSLLHCPFYLNLPSLLLSWVPGLEIGLWGTEASQKHIVGLHGKGHITPELMREKKQGLNDGTSRMINLKKLKTQDQSQESQSHECGDREMRPKCGKVRVRGQWGGVSHLLKTPIKVWTVFMDQQEYNVVVGGPSFKCSGRHRQFACSEIFIVASVPKYQSPWYFNLIFKVF